VYFNDVLCHLLFEAVHYLVNLIVCEPVSLTEVLDKQLVRTWAVVVEATLVEAVANVSADLQVDVFYSFAVVPVVWVGTEEVVHSHHEP